MQRTPHFHNLTRVVQVMKMRGSLFLDETLYREVPKREDYSSVTRFTTRVLRLPLTSSGSRTGMEPVGV